MKAPASASRIQAPIIVWQMESNAKETMVTFCLPNHNPAGVRTAFGQHFEPTTAQHDAKGNVRMSDEAERFGTRFERVPRPPSRLPLSACLLGPFSTGPPARPLALGTFP